MQVQGILVMEAMEMLEKLPTIEIKDILPENEARILAKAAKTLYIDEPISGLNLLLMRKKIEHYLYTAPDREKAILYRALEVLDKLEDVLAKKLADTSIHDMVTMAVRSVFPNAEQVDSDVEKGDYEDIEYFKYKVNNKYVNIMISEAYYPSENTIIIEPDSVEIEDENTKVECIRTLDRLDCRVEEQ